MDSTDKLFNKTSYFSSKVDNVETKFPGILQKEKGNIILNAMFSQEQYQEIKSEIDFVVLGEALGTKVTLLGCHISFASYSFENNNVSIYAIPTEIIFGDCCSSAPMVKNIIASCPALNYMFSGSCPLENNENISKDNPSVLNYTFPKSITANDKYGRIQIYQTFEFQSTDNFYNYNIDSLVEYSFNKSLNIMDAVAKVAAARSLFSFFGNGYISFEDISFKMEDDEKTYRLWMNYKEDVPTVKEPFLIMTSDFENQFQKVWDAWLTLYESANPIPNLFYEIICNHSTRVNGFLNLSQAIEVYSNAFRRENAQKLMKNDGYKRKKEIPLKYIYQDILSEYNEVLELADSNIGDYACAFSNLRNYYTHYNSERYVKPTYDELSSAINILRFVLLTIGYTAVGIPLNCILKFKKRSIFKGFHKDAEAILKYSNK